MIRSFIAVEIPPTVRRAISQMIRGWAQGEYPVRWVKEENLHLTLKFLGEINEAAVLEIAHTLQSIAERFGRFQFSLQGVGCFPTAKSPRIIWIGARAGGDTVKSLQRALADALAKIGFGPELREFSPHLTIARVQTKFDAAPLLETPYESPSFSVDALVLFRSTLTPAGPIYDKLREFPLTARG